MIQVDALKDAPSTHFIVAFSIFSNSIHSGSSESGHPRSSRVSQALSQYGHVAKKKSHALRAK
eukprot:scaffold219122_cov23-Tisochrysis_lutea.AAC.1